MSSSFRLSSLVHGSFVAALAAAVMLTAGGCLVVKGNNTEESGVRVSQPTLDQIKPGETTEAWLVAALGEPSSRRSVDDHTQILRYDHTITNEKGGAVFLLFAGGESTEKT